MDKTVILGSDHGGYRLKEYIKGLLDDMGRDYVDVGCDSEASCDYPVFAQKLAEEIRQRDCLGILVCGTGIGMSMAINRIPGMRGAVCTNEYMARLTRMHNNANVLCMGERVTGFGVAEGIVRAYLETDFEGDRHLRRINLFDV